MDDPSELFSSMRMKRFIKTVKERNPNCYVIFDSPPVLPFADARLLGSLVDCTIFVARENFSKLKQIEEGLGSLPDAQVLGVIYNDTSLAAGHNYGGYY
jgi:Mrp family chromosome partitioning ATPase